jgi:hypothetical protein
MDFWFHDHPKAEREFQQLVVRENNDSGISNETEYFIADIELASSEIGARFDMLAFKWPTGSRRSGKVQLALIEMKYGDSALKGEAGIIEHFEQIKKYLNENSKRKSLVDMAEEQINQLNKLGLIRHTREEREAKGEEQDFKFQVDDSHFEIIFLFASHNPRSTILLDELNRLKESGIKEPNNNLFDLRFFVASTAGYAMHDTCMMCIDQYIDNIKFLNRKKDQK